MVFAFCLVGTGAAVLIGSLVRNEQQAGRSRSCSGSGSPRSAARWRRSRSSRSTARAIAHVTPHAWANDAFSKLLKHGGDLATVLPQVGVLLGFAAVVVSVAVWRLRRSLTA